MTERQSRSSCRRSRPSTTVWLIQRELRRRSVVLVNDTFLQLVRTETHRGLEGRALSGSSTGGRCYGYKTVVEENPPDPEHPRKRFVIDEVEADVAARGLQDRCLVLWTNHIADGPSHSFQNVPVVIWGSAGHALKQAEFVALDHVTNNRLLTTLVNASIHDTGTSLASFGEGPSVDPVPEILG